MILLKLLFFLFLAKIKMCICIRTYVKHFIVTDTILLFFQTPLPVFKVSKTYMIDIAIKNGLTLCSSTMHN